MKLIWRRNLVRKHIIPSTFIAIILKLNWTWHPANANFRIICTTFIIIDLREFFHSTVWCVRVSAHFDVETTPKKRKRKARFERHKRAEERHLKNFFLLSTLFTAFCTYCWWYKIKKRNEKWETTWNLRMNGEKWREEEAKKTHDGKRRYTIKYLIIIEKFIEEKRNKKNV